MSLQYVLKLVVILVIVSTINASQERGGMPLPFTRQLTFGDSGDDVTMAQWLLKRAPCFPSDMTFPQFGYYDKFTWRVVGVFQSMIEHDRITGDFDATTAQVLVNQYLYDGYKPLYCSRGGRKLPSSMKYLIDVPVYTDRTIETTGTLYDSNCTARYTFRARTKGQQNYNELTSNGNTPTGLYFMDLNSPEDDPKLYGPYNVNRATDGILGNALVVVPNIRYGILLHTGEWDHWNTSKPMPDSHGCIHSWPQDIKTISDILTKDLNVTVRENPFGKRPYPFQPQGLLSVWNVDPPASSLKVKCKDERIQELLKEIALNGRD